MANARGKNENKSGPMGRRSNARVLMQGLVLVVVQTCNAPDKEESGTRREEREK